MPNLSRVANLDISIDIIEEEDMYTTPRVS